MRVIGFLLGLVVLVGCTNRSFTPVMPEALAVGTPYTVFAATTREKQPDGSYGSERSETLQRLELTVSIPPSHTPGELQYAYSNPDPRTEFTLAGHTELETQAAFDNRVGQVMDHLPGHQREVVVFVHGYNSTQSESAFRAAQLANDMNLPGAMVIYSWPSKGKTLGYAYDIDSALFARDGLEQLLFELKAAGVKRIVLVAHSMGSLVTMETLRQIDHHKPGWIAKNLGGLVLISPDLDIELFRSQVKALSDPPAPFVVFVSRKDNLLNISARLRGGSTHERLGNISDIDQVTGLPIEIIDTTAFSDNAGSTHFVAGTSPAFITMVNEAQMLGSVFGPEVGPLDFLVPGELIQKRGETNVAQIPISDSEL